MRKNPHGRILKVKPKKQHLSTVPKSCSIYIYIYIYTRPKWYARPILKCLFPIGKPKGPKLNPKWYLEHSKKPS